MTNTTRKILTVAMVWTTVANSVLANPVQKTIQTGGFQREYMVYTPQHPQQEKPAGAIVCLHGFNRTMNDFFDGFDFTTVADSLNLIMIAPQALPEQNATVNLEAGIINSFTNNQISLIR
jgi:poly(3-hydroxybutyrate) depolymerase